jgi:Xaa-Pro aminopeptidase
MSFIAKTSEQQRERLDALRDHIHQQKLDGFFVPLTDEYMNEYVPEYAQRLPWLTGFTGSAGLALVLKDRAALFVDGRYTLQAAQQVDGKLYDICHTSKRPLSAYIKEVIEEGMRIGYDPWLHTVSWLDRVRDAVEGKKAKLVPVQPNPVDVIWENRPNPPSAGIYTHPEHYAGESSASKRTRLAGELAEAGILAAVIGDQSSIAWLLNIRGGDVENTPLALSFAILHANGTVDWFVDPAKIRKLPVEEGVTPKAPEELIKSLKDLGRKRGKVRVDANHTSAAILDLLKDSGAQLDRGLDPCELPKACKNETELNGTRDAHRRDGLALTRFLYHLDRQKPGTLDEITAQDKLLAFRRMDNSFLYPSFNSISGAGPNGAIVHYRATPESNRLLKAGEFYLIDSGGQYPDGTTDVTRTISIGKIDAQLKDHFTRVLKGHIALAMARFPAGTTGAQLDVLARQYLWEAGLDYDHGTGHGVGAFLSVHEGPQGISSRNTVPLKAGMIISNEPGYYLENAYGIRIENLVAVKESAIQIDGKPMLEFETLTLAPIDIRAIDVSMLNKSEREWLNSYHAQVQRAHLSSLEADGQEWLKKVTAPI